MKTAGLAIVAAICVLVLKKDNPAGAYMIALAAILLIAGLAAAFIKPVKTLMDELGEAAQLSPSVLAPLYKVLGITLITRVSSEACRDAGESAIASMTEFAGAAAALYISLPLLSAVFSLICAIAKS